MMLFLILLVVAFIILLPFIGKILKMLIAYNKGGVCQASAALESMKYEKVCFDAARSPTTLQCNRRHVEIGPTQATLLLEGTSKAIPVYDDKTRQTSDKYEFSGQVVNRIFADELLKCWEQFGAGEIPLFIAVQPSKLTQAGAMVLPDFIVSTDDYTSCFICSEIILKDVPKDQLDGTTIKGTQLRKFLGEKMAGKDTTYLDRLNNPKAACEDAFRKGGDKDYVKNGNCWENLEYYFTKENSRFLLTNKIDSANTFAVVMMRKRYDACDSKNKAYSTNFAYVMPVDSLGKACNAFIS